MRIRMQGFIVFDYAKQFPQARKELAQWLEEGKLQRKETIVKGGLKAAEEALSGLFLGLNTGMLLSPSDFQNRANICRREIISPS